MEFADEPNTYRGMSPPVDSLEGPCGIPLSPAEKSHASESLANESHGAVVSGQEGFGVFLAVASFIVWGGFPVYFSLLREVHPLVTLSFRAIFTFPLVLPLLLLRGKWRFLRSILGSAKMLGVFVLTTALLAANWGFFIWLVSRNQAVLASLAGFIMPLLSVLLGILLLRERPAPGMKPAMLFAVVAVIGFAAGCGRFPWESIVGALFFSAYSLVRKMVPVDSTAALGVETLLATPIALAFLIWAYGNLDGVAADLTNPARCALLVGAGILTAVPLLLFGSATRRINLSTVGMYQYICPMLQFLCAVVILGEKMSRLEWVSFFVLWGSLILFTTAQIRAAKSPASTILPTPPTMR